MLDQQTPVDLVLDRLEDYRQVHDNEWRTRCPAHNGNSDTSLKISEGEDERALLHCFGGCDLSAILDALGLGPPELFIDNGQAGLAKKVRKPKKGKEPPEAKSFGDLPDGTYYEFESPAGEVLYIQRHRGPYYRKVGEDQWATYQGVLKDIDQVLYRLPSLIEGVKDGSTIFHLEGCKDVETARDTLGVVATTSGSTSSWRPEFKSHYIGACVVILPDNDEPGRKYAETVVQDLVKVAKSVKVVHLPDLPEGGDLTDWMDAGHTAEEFFEMVEAAPFFDLAETGPWPDPVEIEIELPGVPPLDTSMVPEPLRAWVADTSRRMDNASPDFAAAAAIVMCGALIGRKIVIRPKRHDDWTVTPNLWGGLVGLPASMKTPTLNQVLRPIKKLAAEAREAYEQAASEHELDMMVASAECGALKKKLDDTAKKVASASASRGDLDSVRSELENLQEPEPPTPRRYTTNDTSVEKMAELLMENPDGLLLYRDELTGWLRSLDKVGHETARAFYLEAWNGDGSHEVDRIGRGSLFIKAVCVSVLGGIQPGPLSAYVEGAFDNGEAADGLLQRLQVLVYPDRPDFDPTDLSPDLEARERAYKVFERLAEFDVAGFVGHELPDDDEVPYVQFDDKAQEIFSGWRQTFEGEIVSGVYPPALESHFMKFRSLFSSLALVFEAIDYAADTGDAGVAISETNAMRAYAWAEYLKQHAIRIYSPMLDTPVRWARTLLDHILSGEVRDGMKTRDIRLKGWSRLKNTSDVAEALSVLEDYGWARREKVQPDGGGRPSEVVRLHPDLIG